MTESYAVRLRKGSPGRRRGVPKEGLRAKLAVRKDAPFGLRRKINNYIIRFRVF